jgi:hypothetical protein
MHGYDSGGTVIACTTTDSAGNYNLAAPPSIRVFIRVILGSHVEFVRFRGANANVESKELQAILSADSDEKGGNTMEVITLVPSPTAYATGMDYQDHTTRALKLDIYGTLCKLPLGDLAFLDFEAPGCGHIQQTCVTSRFTDSVVQLPAHSFDITLQAVAPAYPEVTALGHVGYFHRLRERTIRTNLFDMKEVSNAEEASSPESDAAESDLHEIRFAYHPSPDLAVSFKRQLGATTSELKPTGCKTAEATDMQTGSKVNNDGTTLDDIATLPGWVTTTGSALIVSAAPTATIKYPAAAHAVCDWVDGTISHKNQVSFTREEMRWFHKDADGEVKPKDATTAEYKEFAKVLNRTLPENVRLNDLMRCTGAVGCQIATTSSTRVLRRTEFADDHTCTLLAQGGKSGIYATISGYSVFSKGETGCEAQWAEVQRAASSKARAWHRLDWVNDLTQVEREVWKAAGVTKDMFSRGQADGTWQGFSKTVLLAAPAWNDLPNPDDVASVLHFTQDTWGRAWAFVARIFHDDITLLPSWDEDLTGAEQAALETLKYTAGNWAGAPPEKSTMSSWETLAAHAQSNASKVLRITEWHWTRGFASVQDSISIEGCFWDHARGEAVEIMRASKSAMMRNPAVSPPSGNGDRRRRAASRREAGDRACPAGQQPTKDGTDCVECPTNTYRPTHLLSNSQCEQKKGSCSNFEDTVYKGTSAFIDDNVCVPKGHCPPGTEIQPEAIQPCSKCKKGTFKLDTSAEPCGDKRTVECKPGQYLHLGSSSETDDNLCIACPTGTFWTTPQNLTTASECTPKTIAAECPAGQFFTLGTSTSENDSGCADCPVGAWKVGTAPAAACLAKTVTECAAGNYLVEGGSDVADDNHCIRCPAGTFSPTVSSAAVCLPKSPAICFESKGLHQGSSSTANDNVCLLPGKCPAGYHVEPASPQQCTACPTGQFSQTTSDSTTCETKAVQECAAGLHVADGSSATLDDSRCAACPPGTFKGANGTHPADSRTCFVKQTSPASCPAGQHVSDGASTTNDDHECQNCAAGMYQPTVDTTATTCTRKQLPSGCPAGNHLFIGSSTEEDDFECKACPAGFYKSDSGSFTATTCSKKTEELACILPEKFVQHNSTSKDDECVVPARCSAGERVDESLAACEPCPFGEFNPGATTSQTCSKKHTPRYDCVPGTQFVLGTDTTMNDWTCVPCPPTTYSNSGVNTTMVQAWVENKTTPNQCTSKTYPTNAACIEIASISVDDDAAACAAIEGNDLTDSAAACEAVTTVASSAARACTYTTHAQIDSTSAPHCPPGQVVYWGESTVVNDWACVPAPQHVALCTKNDHFGSKSTMALIATGLPERIAPFTKTYTVEMRVRGHSLAVQTEVMVVTGSRFVSDAEMVPFPEGRAILALHDPPGGGSFSTFKNVRATLAVTDRTSKAHAEFISQMKSPGDEVEVDETIKTPTPLGIPQMTALEFKAKMTPTDTEDFLYTTDHTDKVTEKDGGQFQFSYKTSSTADRSGPASDSFLMPALTFQVIEIWMVRFAQFKTACKIRGLSDKSLEPRNDLSAFYFITTNDVETRTLPLLLDTSTSVRHRLDCAEGAVDDCCTASDKEMGCVATNDLKTYCSWMHGDGTEKAEQCGSILDDHWKTQCRRASEKMRNEEQKWSKCTSLNSALLGLLPDGKPVCADQYQQVGDFVECEKEAYIPVSPKKQKWGTQPGTASGALGTLQDAASDPTGAALQNEAINDRLGSDVATGLDIANQVGLGLGLDLGLGLSDQAQAIMSIGTMLYEYWNMKKMMEDMQPAFIFPEQEYKIKCVRSDPDVYKLGECSRNGINANSVEDYCQKANPNASTAEKVCNTFIEPDTFSRAHDNWYNTLSRNYAKQEKADSGPDVTVHYTKLDTMNTGSEPIVTQEVVELTTMTHLAPEMLIDNAMDLDGVKQSEEKRQSFANYNTLGFEGGGTAMSYTYNTGSTANGNNFGGYDINIGQNDASNRQSGALSSMELELSSKVFVSPTPHPHISLLSILTPHHPPLQYDE